MKTMGTLLLCGALMGSVAVDAMTQAEMQSRIDAAAEKGGGIVCLPSGRHVTGTLHLRNNVELRLERGCVLEGSPNLDDYPDVTLEYSEMPKPWHALIAAIGVTNVSVTGEGEIFGNGARFMPQVSTFGRPRGFIFLRCRDVRVTGVALRDTGSWGCYLKECDGVRIERMRIDNHANSNNDGIDVESRNVLIADCDVDSGDDGICLKSDNPNFTVENVEVRNCTVRSCCTALKFGTATHGTGRNIRIHDCVVDACRCGTVNPRSGREFYRENHLKLFPGSRPGFYPLAAIAVENVDGGTIEDVVFERIDVKAALVPVFIRAGSRFHRSFAGVDCGIPYGDRRIFRNIVIRDLKAVAMSPTASSITGVELCRPKDVLLENCEISCLAGGPLAEAAKSRPVPEKVESYPDPYVFDTILPAYGCYVRHADGVRFRNVDFRVREGEDSRRPIVVEDSDFEDLVQEDPAAATWKLEYVKNGETNVITEGCNPSANRDLLLRGEFLADEDFTVTGEGNLIANRWDSSDETGILVWNAEDRPVGVRVDFDGPFRLAVEPEAGKVDATTPIPANSLRLYRFGQR